MGRDDIDIRDATAAKTRIAAGEETWPEEVVAALVVGENPVSVFRKYRGLRQVELADRVGLSKPYISKIESGQKIGSNDVMKAIALALNVDLNDIV
ncbi:helix-turn-helix domain-containing protein [Rhizobium laguerreae]|uniref:helix-turn-helix domain-containing protein n=1 Tax=Rhizobium laguerreae TaxID=1076926 RepID=UPI001C900ED0|nr:helix-turn-helix transcriptional regulator [Rhizobium laguerreae]MBY3312239.1 helix-turn-helix transcriptional regulator [Rhizobium laguerreae]